MPIISCCSRRAKKATVKKTVAIQKKATIKKSPIAKKKVSKSARKMAVKEILAAGFDEPKSDEEISIVKVEVPLSIKKNYLDMDECQHRADICLSKANEMKKMLKQIDMRNPDIRVRRHGYELAKAIYEVESAHTIFVQRIKCLEIIVQTYVNLHNHTALEQNAINLINEYLYE